VNNWGNNIDSLEGGVLRCTTCSKETSTMKTSVDGTNGKGGGGGWRMGSSTMDGCNGKGGGGGCPMGATTVDGWDMKYGRGE
jgi:hypothetical protein